MSVLNKLLAGIAASSLVFGMGCAPDGETGGGGEPAVDLDAVFCSDKMSFEPFADGDGSAGNPYIICSVTQLNNIGLESNYLVDHFSLKRNIDLTGVAFNLIGDGTTGFSGSFEGNDYAIQNFTYADIALNFIGVFRKIEESGIVQNLGVTSANVSGQNYVGALVGENKGIVDNCFSSGTVTGNTRVGGLAGRFWEGSAGLPIVTNSHSSAIVSGSGFVGGLIGWVRGPVTNSYATGAVTASGDRFGGLIGIVDGGFVGDSYATGAVDGNDIGGGLIGAIGGSISSSYATGAVTARDWVGGVTGFNGTATGSGYIEKSYSSSIINARNNVGGISGYVYANFGITDSYFSGTITANDYVGGLTGENNHQTVNSYSSASSIVAASYVGGLHGLSAEANDNCFWDSELSGITISSNGAGSNADGALTTSEMKDPATYQSAGWDNTIWSLQPASYPTL